MRHQPPNKMKTRSYCSPPRNLGGRTALKLLILLTALVLPSWSRLVRAQGITLANPHWNIMLSDFGYSDFLLDNTPGFEGREYLSGEWGAAIAYQAEGGTAFAPRFLEPMFLFPDWPTLSTFAVKSPLAQLGLNNENLPIAQSIITNRHLEITLRHEMLDTVVGTPMGTTPASATATNWPLASSRYVLKQTATIRNLSGDAVSGVQFFQLLHGLQSQRGVYDNRAHAGPLSAFRFDVTQAGIDATAVGAGSSSAGLEDYIGFHASVAPTAFEIGYFGIEGNGVDDHAIGKPSEGVHLSIEANWQATPYNQRQGTDYFAPTNRWVAGAQRWDLGNLGPGQSVSLEVLLSLRTGTRVPTGTTVSGGCNGGSSVPGGLDYEFEDVSSDGSCFGEFATADAAEIAIRVDEGEFEPFTFLRPGEPAQIWKVQFSGTYSGNVKLNFGYDFTLLPPDFDESTLALYEFVNGAWQKLPGTVDPLTHTIAVSTSGLSTFALGVEALVTFAVDATAAPPNSGTINGRGPYADGSSATLAATPNAGYVFANWTENGTLVSDSPSLTFIVRGDRALLANFVAVGAARAITTRSLPANGGATSGDGAYAPGSSATVSATPNPGYKFSKWLDGAEIVSTAPDYTFPVTGDRFLVAKFKPVFTLMVSAEPEAGGEVEADSFYESGELAKLKAKPNAGWAFVNWTQNGIPVSTDPGFQFNVTGNRTLVGHFAPGYRIDVSAEPANGGAVIGGGVWGGNELVQLQASAFPGYVFVGWSEDGDVVSRDAAYSFISTASRTLVANFISQPALLGVLSANGLMALSWPAAAEGWTLQESPDLGPGSWVDSTRPVTIVGNRKQVTLSPMAASGFFRLNRK
jgi:hypothetical protein